MLKHHRIPCVKIRVTFMLYMIIVHKLEVIYLMIITISTYTVWAILNSAEVNLRLRIIKFSKLRESSEQISIRFLYERRKSTPDTQTSYVIVPQNNKYLEREPQYQLLTINRVNLTEFTRWEFHA
jgi:hypothetical protein